MSKLSFEGDQWAIDESWIKCRNSDYYIEVNRVVEEMQGDFTLVDHMAEKSWVDIADFIDCVHAVLSYFDRDDLKVDRYKYARKSFMEHLRNQIISNQRGGDGFFKTLDLSPPDPIDMTLSDNEIRDLLVCIGDAEQHAGLDSEMKKLESKLELVLKNRGKKFS